MKLHEIAHGRSGDKGNKANVAIIAHDHDDFSFLCEYLTEERIATCFQSVLDDPSVDSVTRYELPNLAALNFLMDDALDGGASESLRVDTQGKTYAAWLLREDISEAYDAYQTD